MDQRVEVAQQGGEVYEVVWFGVGEGVCYVREFKG